jgi:hypothetical protein
MFPLRFPSILFFAQGRCGGTGPAQAHCLVFQALEIIAVGDSRASRVVHIVDYDPFHAPGFRLAAFGRLGRADNDFAPVSATPTASPSVCERKGLLGRIKPCAAPINKPPSAMNGGKAWDQFSFVNHHWRKMWRGLLCSNWPSHLLGEGLLNDVRHFCATHFNHHQSKELSNRQSWYCN